MSTLDGYVLESPRYLSHEDTARVNELLDVLSPGGKTGSHEQFNRKLICMSGLSLFVARTVDKERKIVGLLSLIRIQRLRKEVGRIDDVVVDPAHRRKGLAKALLAEAITSARLWGFEQLDLTSRSHRTDAHALYESAGFVRRNTSVWRLSLT